MNKSDSKSLENPLIKEITESHKKTNSGIWSYLNNDQTVTNQHNIFWQYQCIDTMKSSRDKARAWANDPKLQNYIDTELNAIKDLGANCVALDTPYDTEFLPVLKKWVAAARARNLVIWFRGNFSSWEGWFEYPKGMTVAQHHKKTKDFIVKNPDLFQDGDVFTPSPEAENGGPFNQVEKDEHEGFRKYLTEEYTVAKNAFAKIDKKVEVNWLSMNGGLAKRMFDQQTIDAIGKTVTLDHYIKTAPEMGEFINYFKTNYNAKVVIGEFGAPIPEINGPMTETQQATLIDELFQQLLLYKEDVIGVSYWVTWDSSTALYNQDWTPRKAANVVKKYFTPGSISGKIINTINEPLKNITIQTSDGKYKTITNENGEYQLVLLAGNYTLNIIAKDYKEATKSFEIKSKEQLTISATMEPKEEDFFYFIKGLI